MEANESNFDLTKASEIIRYLAYLKKPYFDTTKSSQLGKYAAYFVDEFRKVENDEKNKAKKEEEALKFLKLIISPNFEHYLKVIPNKSFSSAFYQKIGRNRRDVLKYLLCKIDKNKYKDLNVITGQIKGGDHGK
jgi:hypothetical protein